MKRTVFAAAFAAALLAGCGGGGGSQQPVPTVQSPSSPAGSSSNLTVVGHGTLSIKFTPLLHAKVPKGTSSTAKSRTAAATRKPAYVNGSTPCGSSGPASCYLDVWVVNPSSSQATKVVDSVNSGGNLGSLVQPLSIPLYSGNQNDIVAIEYDNDPSGDLGQADILSIGETDFGAFTAGSAPAITLSMNMAVAYVGAMSDPNNANSDAAPFDVGSSQTYNYTASCCGSPGPIYFFAADATGAFATQTTGAGGIGSATPVKSSADNADGDTLLSDSSATGVNAVGYRISWSQTACGTEGLTAVLSGLNPAGQIFYEAASAQYQNVWPGSDYLYTQSLVSYPYYFPNSEYQESPSIPNTTIDVIPPNEC